MLGPQNFSDLYRRFEDKYRGPQEAISKKLESYFPLLSALEAVGDDALEALDLGMGRGEWMRILSNRGWHVTGVDSNRYMTEREEHSAGTVIESDALQFLKSVPDRTYNLVTAFHFVEHLSLNYLLEIISQIHRVLRPGGLVIFETPNPENIRVASWAFYMDPTHVKPLPPELLCFLLEENGLLKPMIFRLNGVFMPNAEAPLVELFGSLFLSSPDYAAIAQKAPITELSESWRSALAAKSQPAPSDMGKLMSLARRSESMLNERICETDRKLSAAISRVARLVEANALLRGSWESQLDDKFRMILNQRSYFNRLKGFFRQLLRPAGQRVIKRWNRLKNSIRKRLPSRAHSAAAADKELLSRRRTKLTKLKRSINKRIRKLLPRKHDLLQEIDTPVPAIVSDNAPHVAMTSLEEIILESGVHHK